MNPTLEFKERLNRLFKQMFDRLDGLEKEVKELKTRLSE